MESLKPFILVLAGMLISIALFSFKNETPKKEYLTAHLWTSWTITKPDLTEVKIKNDPDAEIKILNDLSKEGWELKAVGAATQTGRVLYFERIKQ
jgi:hypothetical protein